MSTSLACTIGHVAGARIIVHTLPTQKTSPHQRPPRVGCRETGPQLLHVMHYPKKTFCPPLYQIFRPLLAVVPSARRGAHFSVHPKFYESPKITAFPASLAAQATSDAPISIKLFVVSLSRFTIGFTTRHEPCSPSPTRLHGPIARKKDPHLHWGGTKLAHTNPSMETQPTLALTLVSCNGDMTPWAH